MMMLSDSLLKRPYPSEESVEDEDIYNHLEDLIEYVSSSKHAHVRDTHTSLLPTYEDFHRNFI